ncbi:MAG: hypothetical protein ACTHN0_07220 [Aquihabitans sp.]
MRNADHVTPKWRRTIRRATAGAALSALIVTATAGTASADTAAASASALNLSVFAAPVPPPATAANDGTQPTQQAGSGNIDISVLPANSIVGAGALGQLAIARADGTSSSCAGLIADSSAVTIGPDGSCSAGSATSGVQLSLGGLANLQAGSVIGSCNATSAGTPTGSATLTNARVTSLLGLTLANLPVNPAPNTGVAVGVLGTSITLNKQTLNADGSLTVIALQVTVAGTGIEIGSVTCGPNAITGDVPVVPAAGAPLALGVLAVAGGAWWTIARRSPVS